ncbi:hypothetical protein SNEBB_008967 [Seison nebaliae]|nr:hypothetical protein SNEBB_008967 [Seison nebaliae]
MKRKKSVRSIDDTITINDQKFFVNCKGYLKNNAYYHGFQCPKIGKNPQFCCRTITLSSKECCTKHELEQLLNEELLVNYPDLDDEAYIIIADKKDELNIKASSNIEEIDEISTTTNSFIDQDTMKPFPPENVRSNDDNGNFISRNQFLLTCSVFVLMLLLFIIIVLLICRYCRRCCWYRYIREMKMKKSSQKAHTCSSNSSQSSSTTTGILSTANSKSKYFQYDNENNKEQLNILMNNCAATNSTFNQPLYQLTTNDIDQQQKQKLLDSSSLSPPHTGNASQLQSNDDQFTTINRKFSSILPTANCGNNSLCHRPSFHNNNKNNNLGNVLGRNSVSTFNSIQQPNQMENYSFDNIVSNPSIIVSTMNNGNQLIYHTTMNTQARTSNNNLHRYPSKNLGKLKNNTSNVVSPSYRISTMTKRQYQDNPNESHYGNYVNTKDHNYTINKLSQIKKSNDNSNSFLENTYQEFKFPNDSAMFASAYFAQMQREDEENKLMFDQQNKKDNENNSSLSKHLEDLRKQLNDNPNDKGKNQFNSGNQLSSLLNTRLLSKRSYGFQKPNSLRNDSTNSSTSGYHHYARTTESENTSSTMETAAYNMIINLSNSSDDRSDIRQQDYLDNTQNGVLQIIPFPATHCPLDNIDSQTLKNDTDSGVHSSSIANDRISRNGRNMSTEFTNKMSMSPKLPMRNRSPFDDEDGVELHDIEEQNDDDDGEIAHLKELMTTTTATIKTIKEETFTYG